MVAFCHDAYTRVRFKASLSMLTHRGLVTHICVGKLTIIGSDNGLSPGRRQAIFWTNAGILSISPLGTNFSEMLIEIYKFSFKKMHVKMSSAIWRPSCLGLNVLTKGLLVRQSDQWLGPFGQENLERNYSKIIWPSDGVNQLFSR